MRRSLWLRAILAGWAFWFTASVVDAGRLPVCPTHNGAAPHADSDHSPAAATGHEGHGTGGGGQDQSHETCTCLGDCCATAPVALRVATHHVATRALTTVPAPTFGDVVSSRLEREHVLPFANGPPALA